MSDTNEISLPEKIETTIIARCVYCKQEIYQEILTEEEIDGRMDTTGHTFSGTLKCNCRDREAN